LREPPDIPGGGIHAGRAAVRAYLETLVEVRRIETTVSDDAVLAAIGLHDSQSRSGVPVDVVAFHLHRLRDGQIMRIEAFLSREGADAALAGG
jgi:ketosteroid isomerase-like protein